MIKPNPKSRDEELYKTGKGEKRGEKKQFGGS